MKVKSFAHYRKKPLTWECIIYTNASSESDNYSQDYCLASLGNYIIFCGLHAALVPASYLLNCAPNENHLHCRVVLIVCFLFVLQKFKTLFH